MELADTQEVMTERECAQFLRWGERHLRRRRKAGSGPPHVQLDTGTIRYLRSHVVAWLEAHIAGARRTLAIQPQTATGIPAGWSIQILNVDRAAPGAPYVGAKARTGSAGSGAREVALIRLRVSNVSDSGSMTVWVRQAKHGDLWASVPLPWANMEIAEAVKAAAIRAYQQAEHEAWPA